MSTTKQAPVATPEIDWDVIDGNSTDFETTYPRMQWVHGEKKASGFNKTGGLFIPKEQYPNFTGEGFEAATLITQDGSEIEGYGATQASLSVIRVKHQWVKDEARNVPLCHALFYVKGCDDPILLSLRGASKSLKFQDAFNLHIAQPVAVANRTRQEGRNALEPFALWFKLKAGDLISITSKDGKSTSIITPFELDLPAVVDRNYAVSLWVGTPSYNQGKSLWRDTKKWQAAPIWEQRADTGHESDAPGFSGDDDASVNDNLLRQLINLATAKGFEERETMLNITHGERELYDQLTNAEARAAINTLKAQ